MIDIMLPKVEPIEVADNFGRYQVEPLEPGFGITLGNALRRVLLSSLPGAAVTSIKIENVYHEFSAIPHVKEDTTELILNIKQLRLRSFADRPVTMRIEASGAGQVSGADIIAPPEIEVVNPDLHIATLDSNEARLDIELTVERGKGFVTADHREGLPIGVIPVDAIFTPIRKVNFQVEQTRVGQVTDYDRLVLELWSDGTISPDEAVAQSAQILVRHLTLLTELVGKPASRVEKQQLGTAVIPQRVYEMPIEDLNLSVRAYNCLKRAGITKVGQVLEMSEDDLLGVRNFGRKSLDELRERLAAHGVLEHSRLTGEPSGLLDEDEESEEEDEDLEAVEEEEEATALHDFDVEEEEEEEEDEEEFEDEEFEYDEDEDDDKDNFPRRKR